MINYAKSDLAYVAALKSIGATKRVKEVSDLSFWKSFDGCDPQACVAMVKVNEPKLTCKGSKIPNQND